MLLHTPIASPHMDSMQQADVCWCTVTVWSYLHNHAHIKPCTHHHQFYLYGCFAGDELVEEKQLALKCLEEADGQ